MVYYSVEVFFFKGAIRSRVHSYPRLKDAMVVAKEISKSDDAQRVKVSREIPSTECTIPLALFVDGFKYAAELWIDNP